MSIVNIWLALSEQALDEYKDKRAQKSGYTGPMDDETYRILSKMADTDNVQRMFKTVTVATKTYTLFSLYLPGTTRVQEALDYLEAQWPSHFIVLGAWLMDGLQVGMEWELDQDYEPTGSVIGAPIYPIHAKAYKIMPDVIEYDQDGNVISTTPATSNTDLRDINLLQGQAPRMFA